MSSVNLRSILPPRAFAETVDRLTYDRRFFQYAQVGWLVCVYHEGNSYLFRVDRTDRDTISLSEIIRPVRHNEEHAITFGEASHLDGMNNGIQAEHAGYWRAAFDNCNVGQMICFVDRDGSWIGEVDWVGDYTCSITCNPASGHPEDELIYSDDANFLGE